MSSTSPISLHDVDNLAQLRDELALQAHLFKQEAKDRWQDAEVQWDHLQHEIQSVKTAVDRSRPELHAAAAIMVDALRGTYADIRHALSNR